MSIAIAQGDHQKHQDLKQGHCSRCGRVWTLAEPQGVCQWCGKQATCQLSQRGSSRRIKSHRQKQKQAHDISKGYDQLPEPQLTYYKVALRFAYKVLPDDQEDLLHDIILHLIIVAERKREAGLPFSEAAMYRTAEHVKDHYWYDIRKRTSGLDCGHCSKTQRRKCKEDWSYNRCPKAIKLESLNKPVIDSEGNMTEFGELIADDKAVDLDDWLDARTFLIGAPQRLKGIARAIRNGESLTGAERKYLSKLRKRKQKSLI
jgi:hypothetical protein